MEKGRERGRGKERAREGLQRPLEDSRGHCITAELGKSQRRAEGGKDKEMERRLPEGRQGHCTIAEIDGKLEEGLHPPNQNKCFGPNFVFILVLLGGDNFNQKF